jgi:hypothetical protein
VAEKKSTKKGAKTKKPAAPVSRSSAGTTTRMGVRRYVRFRPDRSWAVPLAAPTDSKTLGEWDTWYQAVLNSPAK